MQNLFTLLDLKKVDEGIGFEIVEENLLLAPEMRIIPAEVMNGTEMSLTVRTDLPTVAFRKLNEGTPRSKGKYETRIFGTAILDHQVGVDKQFLTKSPQPSRILENHMSGAVEAAFRLCGKQFYYGTGNDAKGFPGLIAQLPNDAAHVADVAGGTANQRQSVWFVRIARETIQFLWGSGTTINMQSTWAEETLYDDSGNPFQGLANWLTGSVGLRMANSHSAFRIKGLTSDSGKGVTDDVLYDGHEKFTTNLKAEPTHILMTSRSRSQLRKSRTNTGSNEKGTPPPLPTDWNGIPIVVTESIITGETI